MGSVSNCTGVGMIWGSGALARARRLRAPQTPANYLAGKGIPAVLATLTLLFGGCQMPGAGYRTVSETELPKHAPTGISFPATAGTLPRSYVHEKVDDAKTLQVGYGDGAWLEVTPSRGGAGAKLAAMKKELLVRHTDTVVTQP